MGRVQLTGMRDFGPVHIWTQHITSVFSRATGVNEERVLVTCITVTGGRDPLAVLESVDEVLALIDSAAAGLLA